MKNGMGLLFMALITFFQPLAICAGDTSLRCGNELVDLGDTMYEVRQACGDPAYEQRIGERTIYTILRDERLKVKDAMYLIEWIYPKDSGIYILTFEGSRLTDKEYSK